MGFLFLRVPHVGDGAADSGVAAHGVGLPAGPVQQSLRGANGRSATRGCSYAQTGIAEQS